MNSASRGPGYDPQTMTVRADDGYQIPRAAADLISPNDMSPERRAEQLDAARELGLGSGFHVPGSWGEKPCHVGVDMASGESESVKTTYPEANERLSQEFRKSRDGFGGEPDNPRFQQSEPARPRSTRDVLKQISSAESLKRMLAERGLDIQRAEYVGLGPFPDEDDWREIGPEDARDCLGYLNSLSPRAYLNSLLTRPSFRKPRAPLVPSPRLHTHAFSRSSSKSNTGVRARSRIKRIGIAHKAGFTFRGFGGKAEISEDYVSEVS